MPQFEIFDTIERLRREGGSFCIATVIRTADVTSAKAGAKAAVTGAGQILGHLGGACVQRAVVTAAKEALETGGTRMIRVKPTDEMEAPDSDGFELHPSGCPSGGTVDILIEAYRQPPVLAIFGDTPIAEALAAHAGLMDFRLARPGMDGMLDLSGQDFVVIASQGTGDLAALKAALASDAGHIALIASHRKAATLRHSLSEADFNETQLARLKAPAGLDLGAIDPREIAISILAEVIQWRNAHRSR